MPHFTATRFVAVPAETAYAVASDVAAYKSFLPLLERSVIRGPVAHVDGVTQFSAELAVGYAKLGVREAFISRVTCDAHKRMVTATSRDAPFKEMKTVWSITEKPGGCDVSIAIDYAMRNMLVQLAINGAMDMAVQKVMSAFEARALSVDKASKTISNA